MTRPIATERLYRTADGRVVREGDPTAAFLLCIAGQEIPKGYDPPADADPNPPKQIAKPANKMVEKPEDK